MQRVIVDYQKMKQEVMDLLLSQYPDGYDTDQLIQFKNSQGQWVYCLEVLSEETIYLVKVSRKLDEAIDRALAEDDDDYYDNSEQQTDYSDYSDDFEYA
ncbi:hypothetical protein [Gilvibacter sediminis]|uniref:hypothetical protein n=1 Tax=Gilvibacter sediminis TaxID=379071 RepID=UPI00234FC0A8|nr:hypothetical protein [Gilvibacter sediminis]MDC7996438.1 hypothetical protein [Gilvibacter sediminis]